MIFINFDQNFDNNNRQKRIMIKSPILFLLVAFIFLAQTKMLVTHSNSIQSQYVPISKRYPGIDLPGANAVVTLEAVYDITCGDTSQFDKILRQVQVSLATSNPGKFSYRFAFQSLPYHISSFKLTQAIKYANDKQGPLSAIKVMRYFFDNIDNWVESALVKTTIANFMNNIAKAVNQQVGLPVDDIRKEVAHYSTTDGETRRWVKYAMGTLRVSGTPTIFVNGARLDGATGMTAAQLVDLLTKLL